MFSKIDKTLFFTTIALLVFGLVIFSSSALGILSYNDVKFFAVLKSQLVYALIGGAFAMLVGILIPFEFYKRYAYIIFGGALAFTSLVFIPALSRFHGGAHRWIDIGPFSLQPSEILKFSFVVFVAMWCSTYRHKFKDFKFGFLPYVSAVGLVSLIMLSQPDFGTFFVIGVSSFVVYFVGGARKNHLLTLFLVGILGIVVLVSFRPYMMDRVTTFFDSSQDYLIDLVNDIKNEKLCSVGFSHFPEAIRTAKQALYPYPLENKQTPPTYKIHDNYFFI